MPVVAAAVCVVWTTMSLALLGVQSLAVAMTLALLELQPQKGLEAAATVLESYLVIYLVAEDAEAVLVGLAFELG